MNSRCCSVLYLVFRRNLANTKKKKKKKKKVNSWDFKYFSKISMYQQITLLLPSSVPVGLEKKVAGSHHLK